MCSPFTGTIRLSDGRMLIVANSYARGNMERHRTRSAVLTAAIARKQSSAWVCHRPAAPSSFSSPPRSLAALGARIGVRESGVRRPHAADDDATGAAQRRTTGEDDGRRRGGKSNRSKQRDDSRQIAHHARSHLQSLTDGHAQTSASALSCSSPSLPSMSSHADPDASDTTLHVLAAAPSAADSDDEHQPEEDYEMDDDLDEDFPSEASRWTCCTRRAGAGSSGGGAVVWIVALLSLMLMLWAAYQAGVRSVTQAIRTDTIASARNMRGGAGNQTCTPTQSTATVTGSAAATATATAGEAVTAPSTPSPPWATCPRATQLRPSKLSDRDPIMAELNRLHLGRCPAVLYPLPPVVALAESPGYVVPNAYPADSVCRSVCPIPSSVDSRGWRGFDADDAHLPQHGGTHAIDGRRLWHMRDYVSTWGFRDAAMWENGWAWARPLEHPSISTTSIEDALPCITPGAHLWQHSFESPDFCTRILPNIKVPFVVAMGGDDQSPIKPCPDQFRSHPFMLHAFIQNAPVEAVGHPKLTVIPSSINRLLHWFLNNYLMTRFLQRAAALAHTQALAQLPVADASALPPCEFLSSDETISVLRDLEVCQGVNVGCTHERSHLRAMLRLDDYEPNAGLMELHRAALRPGFDVSRIAAFYTAHPEGKHLELTKAHWSRDRSKDHEPDESLRVRVPKWVQNWLVVSARDMQEAGSLADLDKAALQRAAKAVPRCTLPASWLSSALHTLSRWKELLLINFSAHHGRQQFVSHFCSGQTPFAHCVGMGAGTDHSGWNPHLVPMYASFSRYMYWLSPFGAGLDCHRTWEAMFVGSIPIVPRSSLDSIYEDGDLPILVVDDLRSVSEELLLAHAPRFAHLERDFPRNKLLQAYWNHFAVAKRQKLMKEYNAAKKEGRAYVVPDSKFGEETVDYPALWSEPPNRCWGADPRGK